MTDDALGQVAKPGPQLVGREREQRRLSALLDAALAGHGGLALVSGEAGIGKTSLVRQIEYQARDRGYLVLTGACYDTGVHTPYEPWHEIADNVIQNETPRAILSSEETTIDETVSPAAIRTRLRNLLTTLAGRTPVLLILEDIHWADPESLEFLRLFARRVHEQSLLLIATYRDTDLPFNQALNLTLPTLVRESNAERITLRALDEDAIATFVHRRYDLPEDEQARLTAHLARRSQGVPFYLVELLRTLEDESRLDQTAGGWTVGELDQNQVPLLVKQVLDARLNQFGDDVRELLEMASVIGQDVSLVHLRLLSERDDDAFADLLERTIRSHLLGPDPSSLRVCFTHALVRDSLYEGTSRIRRQRWHRRIAELLVDDGREPPEIVAHHFREALDPRAATWFIRAGSESEYHARLTAAEQFAAALEMMEQGDATSVDRGWLLTRYARTIRGVDSQRALAIIDTAKTLAEQADDAPLLAYNLYSRGQIRGLVGDVAGAITDLRLSVEILGRLSDIDRERLARYEHDGYIASSVEIEGYLTGLLAIAGYIEEAHARATALIERSHNMTMHGWFTLATTHALTGRPHASLDAFMACRHSLRGINDDSPLVTIALNQLWMYHRPYAADQLEERRQIAQDAERNLERTGGSFGEISPRLASLPWLFLEGDWDATREIALKVTEEANVSSIQHLISAVILARLALAQGDVALAWQMVRRPLPAGSHTPPGHADLEPSLALMRVAVELCLDGGDLIAAQAWLTAHDRWLDWSGVTLGLAESRLLWARIAQASNALPEALEHAQRALEIAEAPRQPLVQAAIYRTLGQIATLAGRVDEARQHLDRALERADACAAIYERALTLLAIAELERRIGESGALESALSEARTIFTRLGAIPALARVEALAVQSAGDAGATTAAAFGLSPRELEVLRLIAIGGRNREIADQLFLSVRTVERHITNLYAKLGIRSRSEAIAFAHTHDIR